MRSQVLQRESAEVDLVNCKLITALRHNSEPGSYAV